MDIKRTTALLALTLFSVCASAADYRLSGRVTDYASATPIEGATVSLISVTSDIVVHAETLSDASGNYSLGGTCTQGCRITARKSGHAQDGQSLPQAPGGPLQIALRLSQPNAIAGLATQGAQDPLGGVELRLERWDAGSGQFATPQRLITHGGRYRFDGLGHGRYRLCAKTPAQLNLLNQCWQQHNQPALLADQQYNAIELGSGELRDGIDFALDAAATIGGRVIAPSSLQLFSAQVELFDASGARVAQLKTDAAGEFRSSGLAAGTYYARALTDYGSGQLYGGIACHQACDVTAGTPIVLGTTALSDIDFSIPARAYISGQVRDAQSGQLLHGATVRLMPTFGGPDLVLQTVSAADGSFALPVPPGQAVRLHVATGDPWVSAIWPDVPCPRHCPFNNGSDIVVAENATVVRDFALHAGGGISGQLFDSFGNAYSGSLTFSLYSATGALIWADQGNYPSLYRSWRILPGRYFVKVQSPQGCEVYAGQTCLLSGELPPGAALLEIVAGADLVADFRLRSDAVFADGFQP